MRPIESYIKIVNLAANHVICSLCNFCGKHQVSDWEKFWCNLNSKYNEVGA